MLSKFNADGQDPSPNNLATVNDGSVRQAAEEYRRWGWPVTPLDGKSPVRKTWTMETIEDEELPHIFTEDRNIGIVLGTQSRVADVDLDSPMAVAAAPHILPEMWRSGRETKPHSHYWYYCETAPPSRTYAVPKPMAPAASSTRQSPTLR